MDVVRNGDLLSLQIEGRGFLGMGELTSKLFNANGGVYPMIIPKKGSRLPNDFYNLCIFEVELGSDYSKQGENCLYGESVRLKHVTTGKYLSISNLTSSESSDRFVCQFAVDRTPSTNMFIIPRYKTRQEGEWVYYNDKVTILNRSGGGGHYIGYVRKNNMVVSYGWVTEGWQLKRFRKYQEETQGMLNPGSFIRLFHKELEGFLVTATDDYHIRQSKSPLPQLIRFTLEAVNPKMMLGIRDCKQFQERKEINTIHDIWQFENVDRENGEPLQWGQPIRIRHVLFGSYMKVIFTERYLMNNGLYYKPDGTLHKTNNLPAYVRSASMLYNEATVDNILINFGNYCISLVNDYRDPNTIFELKNVSAKSDETYVPSNSLLRIMHTATQSYITAHDDSSTLQEVARCVSSTSFDYWFSGLAKDKKPDDSSAAKDDQEVSESSYEPSENSDEENYGPQTSTTMTLQSKYYGKLAIRKLVMTTQGVDQHAFMTLDVANIKYDYIRYASSLVSEITKFLKELKYQQENVLPLDIKEQRDQIKTVKYVILCLKQFITGQVLLSQHDLKTGAQKSVWKNKAMQQTVDKKKNPFTEGGNKEPINRRQKVLHEVNIFEAIFGVIQHYWDIYKSRWIKQKEEELDPTEKLPWSLCKSCHKLIHMLIHSNQSVVDSLLELKPIHIMFEQIPTGWNPAISEIFLATSGRTNQVLYKRDIKSMVDQIADARSKGEFRYEIVDFLSSICAPGGKGHYLIQKWCMELMIGTAVSAEKTPSSLIFHTKIDSTDNSEQNEAVYILINNWGFMRPPYKTRSKQNEKDICYISEQPDILSDKMYDRDDLWRRLDKFLPDESGFYLDLQYHSFQTGHIQNRPHGKTRRDIELRDKEVSYFRSLMKFYKLLCESQNSKCQKVISALIPLDQILLALKMEISSTDKRLFVELLNVLYINSAMIGPLPKTILPTMLVWKGDQKLLNWDENETQQSSRKIFCIASQPEVVNTEADWVNLWEAKSGDEEAKNYKEFESAGAGREESWQTINEMIYCQRLKLYKYVVQELAMILTELVDHSMSLAKTIFKEVPTESHDHFYWKNKFDYWESYLRLMGCLIQRDFFDPEYNNDIDATIKFEDETKYSQCISLEFNEWMINKANDAGKDFSIIPLEMKSEKDDFHYFYNLILNILIQTSPQRHYKLIPDRSIEMYNIIMVQMDTGSIADELADFKVQLLTVLQGLYDLRTSERVYRLWDKSFKPLYKSFFKSVNYSKYIYLESDSTPQPALTRSKSVSSAASRGSFSMERDTLIKMFTTKNEGEKTDGETARDSAREMFEKFEAECMKDQNLKYHVDKIFTQSDMEFDSFADVLLDLLLYNKPKLAQESVNVLHRHFTRRQELKFIYRDATLLLENKHYKVLRLLNSHRLRLIDLTQGFTKIPTKPKEYLEFYRIFKAGNPLIDETVRKSPGIVDLCYCGRDTSDDEYTVFRRNYRLFEYVKKRQRKKNKSTIMLKRSYTKGRNIVQHNKAKEFENKKEECIESQMASTLHKLKLLQVYPIVGKFDLWTTNQELMRNIGLHHNILKLIQRIFSAGTKNQPSRDVAERQMQLLIIKVMYEYLDFFAMENASNWKSLTEEKYVEMLLEQITLDKSVKCLLTKICTDNDRCNELISDNTVNNIIKRINPLWWDSNPFLKPKLQSSENVEPQIGTFGAGCFWGVERRFRALQGVLDARSGYTGGFVEYPTYEQVCGKKTGHYEVVEVTYDPSIITYGQLLESFWGGHDPTQVNGQGVYQGPNYSSSIFFHDEGQKQEAEKSKAHWQTKCSKPVVTYILPSARFWPAELYHQNFLNKNLNLKYPEFPTLYIYLIKTLVQSEHGPKPARQKKIVEKVFQMFSDDSLELNRLLLRTPSHRYQHEYLLSLFEEFKQEVQRNTHKYGGNFFPYRDDYTEFNFHLQLMDLLGLCTIGRNIITTTKCRGLYDDINSLTLPLADSSFPLCIRTSLTRFIHGVYFSDPKDQIKQLEDESLWDFFEYSHFKGAFMNIIKDLQRLITLFKWKEQHERFKDSRKQRTHNAENQRLQQKREKPMGWPNQQTSSPEQMTQDRLVEEESNDFVGVMPPMTHVSQSDIREVNKDSNELKFYLQAENYEDYLFEVLLPFLTDLLKWKVDLTCEQDTEELTSLQKFNWYDYNDLDVPFFIENMNAEYFSLANLFRAIVFHVLQINTQQEVHQKEKWRNGVSGFLVETLNFLTDHFNDSNTILDSSPEAAQAMQVVIITSIHKIKSDALQNTKIQGNIDMTSKFIRDIKKKKLIQEKALPCFINAAIKVSQDDPNALLTASLRQQMSADEILPDFSRYVALMEKKLSLFIRWTDIDLTQIQAVKSGQRQLTRRATQEYLEEHLGRNSTVKSMISVQKEESLSEDDLERDEDSDSEEENLGENLESQSESESEESAVWQEISRKNTRSSSNEKQRQEQRYSVIEYEQLDLKRQVKSTTSYADVMKQLKNVNLARRLTVIPRITRRDTRVETNSKPLPEYASPGPTEPDEVEDNVFTEAGKRMQFLQRQSTYGSTIRGNSKESWGYYSVGGSQNFLSGDDINVESITKIDKKHFMRWGGFGGGYLAKLIEIIADNSNIGTGLGDAFHVRMMQALLIKHDAEELNRFPLNRKQEAMSELGVTNMVMNLISRSRHPQQLSQYVKTILPEAVELGSNLLALGNEKIQKEFLVQYKQAVEQRLPSQYFLISIRQLVREARNNIEDLGKDPFLRDMIQNLLNFVKNFCSGHFLDVQIFLHEQNTQHDVDLVTEIASLLHAICEKIKSRVVYIDSEDFIEKMCPSLITNSNKRKRLIAWYKHTSEIPNVEDINLAAQVYRTLSETIQGPCEKNQIALVKARACRSVQEILEYIQSFFYRWTDHCNQFKWSGHGISVYYDYQSQQRNLNDIDATEIARFCKLMESIRHDPDSDPTGLHILVRHHGPEYFALVEGMDRLEQNILVFMTSLLEGNQSSSVKGNSDNAITQYIKQSFDEDVMIHSLWNYYKTADPSKAASLELELKGDKRGQWLSRLRKKIFLYYSFMTSLTDKDERGTLELKKKIMFWENTCHIDMSKIVGRIEVINNNKIEVIYFPLPPSIRNYWHMPAIREIRNKVIEKINRKNPEEKVADFHERSEELIWYIKNISMAPKQQPLIGHILLFIANYERYWRVVLNLLTLFINIFMIFVLKENEDEDDVISDLSWAYTVLTISGFIHLAFTMTLWQAYFFKKGKFHVEKFLRRNQKRTIRVHKYIAYFIVKIRRLLEWCRCIWCRKVNKGKQTEIIRKRRLSKKVDIRLGELWWATWYLFTYSQVRYMTLWLVLSILGAFISPGYFAFHLIMLVVDNPLVQQVVKSVWGKIRQLIAVLILAIILLFWYSLVTFKHDQFRNQYNFEGDKMVWDSLLSWFRTHVDYGLTVNAFWIEEPLPVEAIPINMTYFIVINLILTSVISAIIIDTFILLRRELIWRQSDTEDRCFIWNIDRDTFDKLRLNFRDHIKKEHHMWNYLFFRAYLDEIDESEMTGQETYIYNEIKNKRIKYYPIKKAITVERRRRLKKKDLPALFKQVDALQKRIDLREEDREDMAAMLAQILGRIENDIASKS